MRQNLRCSDCPDWLHRDRFDRNHVFARLCAFDQRNLPAFLSVVDAKKDLCVLWLQIHWRLQNKKIRAELSNLQRLLSDIQSHFDIGGMGDVIRAFFDLFRYQCRGHGRIA